MKSPIVPILPAFFLVVLFHFTGAYSDIYLPSTSDMPAPVTLKTLNSKIKDAQTNSELDEQTKSRLIEYYQKTIRNLEESQSNNAATEAFIHARKTDPELAAQIRKKLGEYKVSATAKTGNIFTRDTPLAVMERKLLVEKANLASVKAKRSDIEQQMALSAARPNVVQQRLIQANLSQKEITARLLQGETQNQPPLLAQAIRWMLETKLIALRTEITMLDQELLSLPMHSDFLDAGLAWYEFSYKGLSERVASIQDTVNKQRQIEAEKARAEAEIARRQLQGKPLLIQKLANENTLLTDELGRLAGDLDRITRVSETAHQENERIQSQFQNIRKKLEIGGFGSALGQLLVELSRQLPEPDVFHKREELRETRVAEIGLKQIKFNEEYRELSSITDYVDRLTASMTKQQAEKIRADLIKLATSRKELLFQLNKLCTSYLQALSDYEFIDQKFLTTINDYEYFLAQNMIWIRSSPLPSLAGLEKIPENLDWLISPVLWREIPIAFLKQATSSPVPGLGLVCFLFLLWKSKQMRASLKESGANIGKVSKDSMSVTFYALLLTLLLASSWPLLLALLSWQLSLSIHATPFTNAVSDILLSIAIPFFHIRVFSVLCEPDGLASAHFQMPQIEVKRLHRELKRMMTVLLPTQFIFMLIYRYDLAASTGEAGRILIAIFLVALTVFLYRIVPSRQMLLSIGSDLTSGNWLLSKAAWLRWLLFAILLVLLIFDLIGYIFTAALLTLKLVYSLFFIANLFVVERLTVRWLLLTQRRLAWQTALEKRATAKAKREAELSGRPEMESESVEVEEPQINIAALSRETLHLLHMSLLLIAVFGFLIIWGEVLPAFSWLNGITVWSHMASVSGEQQLVPVTLLDLARAILIAFITLFIAKYLPSLLEIIMLQRTSLSAGSRYTVTTLTNYIIVAIGAILFFNAIGADWSRVQWLIAALGVGIGFGLQEIVANFISGLIILFERPIRVGDIVTIGNHDGTVVRIRIRTTTIRNWDRQELLVPNKQFITDQLINWTLSETTTRIVIPVGLAYGGDVELAMKIMMQAAEEHPDVLSDPGPSVVFDEFGDNALSFKLRCFVAEIDHRVPVITALHKEINRKFNEAGLVIAYPQRDVHLDTNTPLQVCIQQEEGK